MTSQEICDQIISLDEQWRITEAATLAAHGYETLAERARQAAGYGGLK